MDKKTIFVVVAIVGGMGVLAAAGVCVVAAFGFRSYTERAQAAQAAWATPNVPTSYPSPTTYPSGQVPGAQFPTAGLQPPSAATLPEDYVPPDLGLPLDQRRRIGTALAAEWGPLTADPRLYEYAGRMGVTDEWQARAMGEQLTRLGLKRLSAQELDDWHRLRGRLAAESAEVCAGLWTGVYTPQSIYGTLARFTDDEVRTWARVTARAALLELEGANQDAANLGASPEALRATLEYVQANAAPAEGELLTQAFALGVALPGDQACHVMNVVLRVLNNAPQPQREQYIRSLAAL